MRPSLRNISIFIFDAATDFDSYVATGSTADRARYVRVKWRLGWGIVGK